MDWLGICKPIAPSEQMEVKLCPGLLLVLTESGTLGGCLIVAGNNIGRLSASSREVEEQQHAPTSIVSNQSLPSDEPAAGLSLKEQRATHSLCARDREDEICCRFPRSLGLHGPGVKLPERCG